MRVMDPPTRTAATPTPWPPREWVERALNQHQSRADKFALSVEEYVFFRARGYLIVPGLVAPAEVAELREHTADLMQGRLPEQIQKMDPKSVAHGVQVQQLEAPPAHLSPEEKADFWLRIHMLHRKLELHERYLLHPRILDVLEALIGPDVLALQTMLFLKGPGKPGQGLHQDSYYIPTHPDTLCGAWLAIDDVDEENGGMFFTPGSQNEPVYPPAEAYGYGDEKLKGILHVSGVSDTDDKNDLAKIYAKFNNETPARMKAGDVAFFGGHVLHRSYTNRSKDRFRRSFVGHYCNARSFTDWGAGSPVDDPHRAASIDPVTGATNGSHILARGDTHLAYALPKFGTPCAALLPQELRRNTYGKVPSMMGTPGGPMGMTAHGTDEEHDKAHATKTGY